MSKSVKPKVFRRIDNPKEMQVDQAGGFGAVGKILTKDKKDKSAKCEAPSVIFDARMMGDEEEEMMNIIEQVYQEEE